jgi:uncharacterized membrane protein
VTGDGGMVVDIGLVAGALLLIYGIFKVVAVSCALSLSAGHKEWIIQNVPGASLIFGHDETLAGLFVDYILLAFSSFTILHGLSMMHALKRIPALEALIDSRITQYSVYGLLGAVTVLFYSLVLFTKVPIPKHEENRRAYWINMFLVGVSLLLVPLACELWLRSGTPSQGTVAMVLVLIISFLLSGLIVAVLTWKKRRDDKAAEANTTSGPSMASMKQITQQIRDVTHTPGSGAYVAPVSPIPPAWTSSMSTAATPASASTWNLLPKMMDNKGLTHGLLLMG